MEEVGIELKTPTLEIKEELESLDTSLLFETEPQSMDVQPYIPQDIDATDESIIGVCGLNNLGNTCYMNSVLQCLLHCNELIQCLLSQNAMHLSSEEILKEFLDLQTKYWSGKWSVVVPKSFKDQLGILHPQFAGSGQHDAQEFLALFLGSMHQELRKQIENKLVKKLDNEDIICEGGNIELIEEKSKRKRSKSIESANDENLPNNKRIDSSSTFNKQHLTLNSFLGKEKKTANVNVLCAEVEVDEEVTTDHSNKFPQMNNLRLNNGQYFDENVTGVVQQHQSLHKSVTAETSELAGTTTKDIKMAKLKHPNYKETNVLADIKRVSSTLQEKGSHNFKEFLVKPEQKISNEDFTYFSKGDTFNKSLEYFQSQTVAYTNGLIYGNSVSSNNFGINDKITSLLCKHNVQKQSQLLVAATGFDTLQDGRLLPNDSDIDYFQSAPSIFQETKNFGLKRKIYSVNKVKEFQTNNVMPMLGVKSDTSWSSSIHKTGLLTDNNKVLCLEEDVKLKSCCSDLESNSSKATGGCLVDKFLNIFVGKENDLASNSKLDRSNKNNAENCCKINNENENNSNIRGDICGNSDITIKSKREKLSEADIMWNEYTKQNKSAILDNFQGQLESTVVCCKCSHRSTMYEPFMYLSVPIPHALEQQYDVWFVPLDGPMSKHSVYTLKQGQVQDLKNSLESCLKLELDLKHLDLSNFVLCEMKNNSILAILENTMRLKSLNKSRHLKIIEVLDTIPEQKDNTEPLVESAQPSAWNSCCICLEDLADPELLRHNHESCSITMCHTCLQTSAEHYGLESFECPMCHKKCSPTEDFIQLASNSLDREVVISVSFTCTNKEKITSIAPSKVFKTLTTLTNVQDVIKQLLPKHLLSFDDFDLFFTTLDGATCSRCEITKHCLGCTKINLEHLNLLPGDNITVRFSNEFKLHKKFQLFENFTENKINNSALTLEHCLKAFTKKETLDDRNPWFCPSCKKFQTAEKRLRVCRWPPTLIVYIKRFLFHSKTSIKVDDEVHFPLESFRPGLISGTDSININNYDLTACVSHYGGIYSGHYTAYSKHLDTQKWYLYNDENTSEKIPSNKDSSNAYVLFYQVTTDKVKNNMLKSEPFCV